MWTGFLRKKLTQAAAQLGVASLFVSPGELRAQCAMCWQALANSAEGKVLVQGFRDGIVFLLVVPFLVVGLISFLIHKAQRPEIPATGRESRSLVHPGGD